MWNLPGPWVEPVSPSLAGGFFPTKPSGNPERNSWCYKVIQWITSPRQTSWYLSCSESQKGVSKWCSTKAVKREWRQAFNHIWWKFPPILFILGMNFRTRQYVSYGGCVCSSIPIPLEHLFFLPDFNLGNLQLFVAALRAFLSIKRCWGFNHHHH